MGWKVRLTEPSANAMTYAARTRQDHQVAEQPNPKHYEDIEQLVDGMYPIVGEETIYVPHTHLDALLDTMILALFTMPMRSPSDPIGSGSQRAKLNAQKLKLTKHLASDAVTRLSTVTS